MSNTKEKLDQLTWYPNISNLKGQSIYNIKTNNSEIFQELLKYLKYIPSNPSFFLFF